MWLELILGLAVLTSNPTSAHAQAPAADPVTECQLGVAKRYAASLDKLALVYPRFGVAWRELEVQTRQAVAAGAGVAALDAI